MKKIRMKKVQRRVEKLLTFSLLSLLTLTSCGDLFDFEPTVSPYHMEFDRHEYYIMVGDTGAITPIFDPDTISNMTVYWMSKDPSIVTFYDNKIVAVQMGETTVTGVSIEYQIYDTCRVYVLPRWMVVDAENYPYDMVVYANPSFDGQPLTTRQDVAVFCDQEIRGIGEWKEWNGVRYMRFRIYSRYNPFGPFDNDKNPQDPLYPFEPEEQPEKFVFRIYDHQTHQLHESPDTLTFDGEAHGTLSSLYELKFTK